VTAIPISEPQEDSYEGYMGLTLKLPGGVRVFVFDTTDGRQRGSAKGADFDLAHYIRDALEWRGTPDANPEGNPLVLAEDAGADGVGGVSFRMPSGGHVFVCRVAGNLIGDGPEHAQPADWADARELVAGLDRLHFKPVRIDHLMRTLQQVYDQSRAVLASDMPGDFANARPFVGTVADVTDSAMWMLNRLNEALTEKLNRPEAFGISPPRHTCGECRADITADVQAVVRAAVLNAKAQSVPDAGEGGDRAASDATGGQTPAIPLPEGWGSTFKGPSGPPRTEPGRVQAPWSDEYVNRLNAHQNDNSRHPYTCGSGNRTDSRHLDGEGKLIATKWGWLCPFCDYRQSWAVGRFPEGESPGRMPAADAPRKPSLTQGGVGELAGSTLLKEAKKLLALMDDVPIDVKLGDETDRVFPRYEFDGLRAAIEAEERAGTGQAGTNVPRVPMTAKADVRYEFKVVYADGSGDASDDLCARMHERLVNGLQAALGFSQWPDHITSEDVTFFIDGIIGIVKAREFARLSNEPDADDGADAEDEINPDGDVIAKLRSDKAKLLAGIKDMLMFRHWPDMQGDFVDGVCALMVMIDPEIRGAAFNRLHLPDEEPHDPSLIVESHAGHPYTVSAPLPSFTMTSEPQPVCMAVERVTPLQERKFLELQKRYKHLLAGLKWDVLGLQLWPSDFADELTGGIAFVDGVVALVKGVIEGMAVRLSELEVTVVPLDDDEQRPLTPGDNEDGGFDYLRDAAPKIADDEWKKIARGERGAELPNVIRNELHTRLRESGKCCERVRLKEKKAEFQSVGRTLGLGSNTYPLPVIEWECLACGAIVRACIDPERDYDGVKIYREAQEVAPVPKPREKLGQQDVVEMVLEERRYQDERWGSIHERAHEVGAWLTLMKHHVGKAAADWSESSGDEKAVHGVRKVAAIAVACLEQHGTPEHYRNAVESKKIKHDSDGVKKEPNDDDRVQEGR
jgi:hypothetical protein